MGPLGKRTGQRAIGLQGWATGGSAAERLLGPGGVGDPGSRAG
jgi:hypothetical protein